MPIPVRTILCRKGWGTISISPHNTLLEVAEILFSNHIGAAPVVDKDGTLVGLVSERDIVIGLAEHDEDVGKLTASDIMSRSVQTCSPDCTVLDAMQLMTTHRHRHIPILEDGVLMGLVSIGDVVKYRLEEAEQFVEEMRAYVMQGDPAQDPGVAQIAAH